MTLPLTRADCINGARPCPYSSCRHHMNAAESCALDVADQGAHDRTKVAALLGVSRERVRQIENEALTKLLRRTPVKERAEIVRHLREADAGRGELASVWDLIEEAS